jgi:hypothetical protein
VTLTTAAPAVSLMVSSGRRDPPNGFGELQPEMPGARVQDFPGNPSRPSLRTLRVRARRNTTTRQRQLLQDDGTGRPLYESESGRPTRNRVNAPHTLGGAFSRACGERLRGRVKALSVASDEPRTLGRADKSRRKRFGKWKSAAARTGPHPDVTRSLSSFTRDRLVEEGFRGFVTFEELRGRLGDVPSNGGVYIVLREGSEPVSFRDSNPGGRFKGRDPTGAADVLRMKWVEGCEVVYIGKGNDIRRRLKHFADFGSGKPIGHWGGRYIWQLADSANLLVAWMACASDETARMMETRLLRRFGEEHGGRLPYANIADPT